MDQEKLQKLFKALLAKLVASNGSELSYIELKENNIDPDLIGTSISAISNVCILEDLDKGYLIFGVNDGDLSPVGVNFDPYNLKMNSSKQDLEIWLRQMVLGVDFRFMPFKIGTNNFLIIEISKALGRLATFKTKASIRIGKNTSSLRGYPEIEKKIWSKLDKGAFWRLPAKSNVQISDVVSLLDHEVYFTLAKLPQPTDTEGVINRFEQEGFIIKDDVDSWSITNLGALLLSRDMKAFPLLQHKTPRVITYDGDNKLATVIKDHEGIRGYASGFEALISWIDSQIPEPQEITKTFREQKTLYPDKAIRELVANALIHQDCEEVGMRPIIEIYKSHIDISNPGNCLVGPERILGAVPKARNEILVDVMKRLYICETRGSGIPRTIEGVEESQLPAPKFIDQENAFKVSLYSYRPFESLDNEEKIRACFQHVAFMHVQGYFANNESLRKRFGLGEKKTTTISKLVKLVKDRGLIKEFDPASNSKKFIRYVPFWA